MRFKIILASVISILALGAAIIVYMISTNDICHIDISSTNIKYGQEGYVIVSTKGMKDKADAFDVHIGFDPSAIEITGIDKGFVVDELVVSDCQVANLDGKLVLFFVDYTAGDNKVSKDGDIAYIRFKSIKPVKSKFTVDVANVYDAEVNRIDTKNGKGLVRIEK